MTKIISRLKLAKVDHLYREVTYGERFHDHKIIKDRNGVYRWDGDAKKAQEIMEEFGAKDLNELFSDGASLNDPKVRELYRWKGVSIFLYWETFYWEVNNEDENEWDPSSEEFKK